ncbi:hypothetical protein ES708_27617 [subsurface metagenome]
MGKIGEKLIYRKRKKFDDVKKYTKTVNPDLPGQKKQKGYFKEAISEWQKARYSSIDIQAWNVFAGTKKVTVSGFNMFTRLKIAAQKEGKVWTKLTNCSIYDITGEGFKVDIDVESDLSGVLYLGTSKFSMLKEFEGTFSVNKYTFTVTGLLKETKYFFYIKNMADNDTARTGIYGQKTVIEIPIIINIGMPAIDRSASIMSGYTEVDKNNPANISGTVNKVEIFAVTGNDMANVEVGIFYEESTIRNQSRLTTRDSKFIGTVVGGSVQTFDVNLTVEAGDYIGIFWTGGRLEYDSSGPVGDWRKAGDNIPCTNVAFEFYSSRCMSIHGYSV